MSALPPPDPGKTVELVGGPLDGLCIRVASSITGSWLPAMSGDAMVLVEYHKAVGEAAHGQEVWAYKPSIR